MRKFTPHLNKSTNKTRAFTLWNVDMEQKIFCLTFANGLQILDISHDLSRNEFVVLNLSLCELCDSKHN